MHHEQPNAAPARPRLAAALSRRPDEAEPIRQRYVRRFGEDRWSATIERLLAAGEAGVAEAKSRPAQRDLHDTTDGTPVAEDAQRANEQAAHERSAATALGRAGAATRADLFHRIAERRQAETESRMTVAAQQLTNG